MRLDVVAAAALCAAMLFGCATHASDAEAERAALAMMKTSFRAQGQAGLDRLDRDEVQALCSKHPNGLPRDLAEKLEKAQLATIRYPASGSSAGQATRSGDTRTARSTTLKPSPPAPICRASGTTGSSPRSRSRTSWRCCSIRIRP